jgi:hypothetical protein
MMSHPRDSLWSFDPFDGFPYPPTADTFSAVVKVKARGLVDAAVADGFVPAFSALDLLLDNSDVIGVDLNIERARRLLVEIGYEV